MKKAKSIYPFHLNISVIFVAILLGAIVTSTFVEYSVFASNEIQLVDCEEDGDSEEIEVKDLSQIIQSDESRTFYLNTNAILHINRSTEIRYCKTPTPPPEC